VTVALQLFSKFNCKELLFHKYVNGKDIPMTSSQSMNQKVAVVTGSSSGMGYETSLGKKWISYICNYA
jgi:hypothetical protein